MPKKIVEVPGGGRVEVPGRAQDGPLLGIVGSRDLLLDVAGGGDSLGDVVGGGDPLLGARGHPLLIEALNAVRVDAGPEGLRVQSQGRPGGGIEKETTHS